MLMVVILALCSYLGIALVFSLIPVQKQTEEAQTIEIFLRSNGVHTDLVLPVNNEHMNWAEWVAYEHTQAADTNSQWVAFGWGDKAFYTQTPSWEDLKPNVAFKAAFGLSSGALHTRFFRYMSSDEQTISLKISEESYQLLVAFIMETFETTANQPIVIPHAYGQYDAFYEAKGRYHFFHTCNTWTNNALKAAGLKACLWTPFDKGIFHHYR